MITHKIGKAMGTQLDRVNEFSFQQRIAEQDEQIRALREQIIALRERLASYEDQVSVITPRPTGTPATLHNGRPIQTWSQLAKRLPYSYHQIRRYTLSAWEHVRINGTYFVYVDTPLIPPVKKQKARRKN